MRVPRHASSSQAASRKRTFHVLIQPDISCANDMHRLRWLRGSALWRIIRPQSGITISKTSGGAMTRKMWFALAVMALFGRIASAQDAKSVLQSATKAMGDVKSIQYSGTG